MTIRVLQIITKMDRGGIETRLMDIYRNINREKVQFDFYACCKEKGSYDEEINTLGGKVFYEPSLSIASWYAIPNRFCHFLRQHDEYRIVHCHLNQWCGYILKGAKEAGVPVRIAHSRMALKCKTLRDMVKNLVKIPVKKNATKYFAVSREAGNWLYGERATRNGKVQIWPNAVDCRRFRYDEQIRNRIREELGMQNKFILMHVGNLRPEKNHSFLLDIFFEVCKIDAEVVLICVGEGVERKSLEEKVKELGMEDKVIFLGSRTDVSELLQAGDVFVFPSFYEGFPGAVLEAEAAGLPCLISDSITSEVSLTPEIKMLSLTQTALEWAKTAIECKKIARKDNYRILCDAGYDIETLAKDMEAFYCSESLTSHR